MNNRVLTLLLPLAYLFLFTTAARAQDKVDGKEPIVPSIDPSKLTYDYLVDGDLPQDDPANKKFKTLQAACAVAPAGTEAKPTVIGIKPNVYLLPGGNNGASLTINKNWITLLGLTNNRRSVVLADNRGHMEGACGQRLHTERECHGILPQESHDSQLRQLRLRISRRSVQESQDAQPDDHASRRISAYGRQTRL